jgi:two-component system response regulator AtoC
MRTPLIGVSQAIEKARELIRHVSETGLNILVSGESGVGKEVIAQNLYYDSTRKDKPFIKINCAALPDGLLESELFGYEQGAFTGADRKKKGKFELSNKGVLFLDEIGDMSMLLQGKLLHVLQSGEFAPLGSENDFKTDTWVIAATNCVLENAIVEGTFRKDLYYRLSTIKIHIPPLRERPEDIPYLVDYYIDQYNSQFKRNTPYKISHSVLEKMAQYYWPGNVRELQNLLKRLVVVGDHRAIMNELESKKNTSVQSAQRSFVQNKTTSQFECIENDMFNNFNFTDFTLKDIKKKASDKAEKEAISYVLSKTQWNRSRASEILKISYKTILYKISELNIKPPV